MKSRAPEKRRRLFYILIIQGQGRERDQTFFPQLAQPTAIPFAVSLGKFAEGRCSVMGYCGTTHVRANLIRAS